MRRRWAAWALAIVPLLNGCDFSFSLSIVSDDFDHPPPLAATVASDPAARFFLLRARGAEGLAQLVDGAGNRAGALAPDRSLAPELSIVYPP